MPAPVTRTGDSSNRKVWVDPESLPDATGCNTSVSDIAGNVPDLIKQQCLNTFAAYGIGDDECFAASIGKKVYFKRMDIEKREGGLFATTVNEVTADKCEFNTCQW